MMKKIAIVGAAGYTGDELLRLLLRHPNVEITCVTSREHAGKTLSEVNPRHSADGIRFVEPDVDRIAEQAEIAFLCVPHGLAAEYAAPLFQKGVIVIDVSADFRLKDATIYEQHYNKAHPAVALLTEAVYGLPEKNRAKLRSASLIACPGCYPTSVLLPATPLLKNGLATADDIVVASISGVTGAGRKADTSLLFAECNESIRAYSVTGHRHVPEIEQELSESASQPVTVLFTPHLAPVNRGLHSALFMKPVNAACATNDIADCLDEAYKDEPFVRVLPHGRLADTKRVTHTNVCEIGFAIEPRTNRIVVTSAIDNLTKGAAGQAIQCMNIRCGYDETAALL